MYICLFEDAAVRHLAPLVTTRAAFELRLGMMTVLEAAEAVFRPSQVFAHCRPEVAGAVVARHPEVLLRTPEGLGVLYLNARYAPEAGPAAERLLQAARPGEPARAFVHEGAVVGAWLPATPDPAAPFSPEEAFAGLPQEPLEGARLVGRLWDLVTRIGPTLEAEYAHRVGERRVYERPDALVKRGALLVEPERIFIAAGAVVQPGAILNAETGPIYIDEGATVMEAAVLRGPLYLGKGSYARIGANLAACAFGPTCKVGGEVHDSILVGQTNKAHAGFMGHSYLGQWCNLGAGTITSNLRNDYQPVSLYNAALGAEESSGEQFLGLFMGDHSKAGITTMFNTGAVVGVCCNLYGSGFMPRYVPSFTWGCPEEGFQPHRLGKALQVAEAAMARRNQTLSPAERDLLTALSGETAGLLP